MLLLLLTIVLFCALAQSLLFVSELVAFGAHGASVFLATRAWTVAAFWAVFYLLTKLA